MGRKKSGRRLSCPHVVGGVSTGGPGSFQNTSNADLDGGGGSSKERVGHRPRGRLSEVKSLRQVPHPSTLRHPGIEVGSHGALPIRGKNVETLCPYRRLAQTRRAGARTARRRGCVGTSGERIGRGPTSASQEGAGWAHLSPNNINTRLAIINKPNRLEKPRADLARWPQRGGLGGAEVTTI